MKKRDIIFNLLVNGIIHLKFLREYFSRRLQRSMYNDIMNNRLGNLREIQRLKYLFFLSVLKTTKRQIQRGFISKRVVKKMLSALTGKQMLVNRSERINRKDERYKKNFKEYAPRFIVLSPTQHCNIRCRECYAISNDDTDTSLPWKIVIKIMNDVYYLFGRRFMVISGGEPFLYRQNGKTILDLCQQYRDVFFLIFTNGTMIDENMSHQLAELGNVSLAISIEGFEKETDYQRGKGVFTKVLQAMKNLRKHGVPFGISVTASNNNLPVLLGDDFYDFYIEKQGAIYVWQFQMMPVGHSQELSKTIIKPEDRVKLYRKWKELIENKNYAIADFPGAEILSDGCLAYGRWGGYLYINWDGNIMPCVFVPYYVDNVFDIYQQGKNLGHALQSDFMKNGRKWQKEYGFENTTNRNGLACCSYRDNYENFHKNIITKNVKPENMVAEEILHDKSYYNLMKDYGREIHKLTRKIWQKEFIENEEKHYRDANSK